MIKQSKRHSKTLDSSDPNDLHERETVEICRLLKDRKQNMFSIGALLLSRQEHLGHGEFLPYLEEQFDLSARTAYNWINAAKLVAKFATVATLNLSARLIIKLYSSDFDDDDIAEVLKRIEAGEQIRAVQVDAIVSGFRTARWVAEHPEEVVPTEEIVPTDEETIAPPEEEPEEECGDEPDYYGPCGGVTDKHVNTFQSAIDMLLNVRTKPNFANLSKSKHSTIELMRARDCLNEVISLRQNTEATAHNPDRAAPEMQISSH